MFYSINNNTYGIVGYWSGTGYYSFYGNGAVGGTSFPNTSDARLKDVTEELDKGDCLARIQKLHGVKYTWKEGTQARRSAGDKVEIGLLAQDVMDQFPEVVTETVQKEITGVNPKTLEEVVGKTLSVDYGRLTAVLIEALKEATDRIEALEATVKKLESN